MLGVLFETVRDNTDFARNLHEHGGTDRLRLLARSYPVYGSRVCKYASQVEEWEGVEENEGSVFFDFGNFHKPGQNLAIFTNPAKIRFKLGFFLQTWPKYVSNLAFFHKPGQNSFQIGQFSQTRPKFVSHFEIFTNPAKIILKL